MTALVYRVDSCCSAVKYLTVSQFMSTSVWIPRFFVRWSTNPRWNRWRQSVVVVAVTKFLDRKEGTTVSWDGEFWGKESGRCKEDLTG